MSEVKAPQPAVELPIEELTAIIAQAEVRALSASESAKLRVLVATFALLKEGWSPRRTSAGPAALHPGTPSAPARP
jgi:hypothetical protein